MRDIVVYIVNVYIRFKVLLVYLYLGVYVRKKGLCGLFDRVILIVYII